MKAKISMLVALALMAGSAMTAETCKEHEHGHDHDHVGGAGVEVSAAASEAMGLKTVTPEKRRMVSTVSLFGRVELAPDARTSVATPVGGRLALKVRPLDTVKAGAVLFSVDSPDIRAKTKEIEILNRRLKVYREANRAAAELEAQLALREAERKASLMGAEEREGVVFVRAPVDARVESCEAADGAGVSQGASVVSLVRPERMRFKGLITPAEAQGLRDGMRVTSGAVSGVLHIGYADESGLTPVYATFDAGSAPVRPGERLRVDCVTDESETPVVAIPSACIVRVGLEPTVFVRDEPEETRFVAVKVVPGRVKDGWTEVKGLPDDDDLAVVREGAYELKIALAAQAGSTSAGHYHADGTFHEGGEE